MWANLSVHIKEKEERDLPAIERALARNDLDSLEKRFEGTKLFAPTRSHRSAPDKPPFETVLGLLTAPIDKLGDMLRKFPDQSKV